MKMLIGGLAAAALLVVAAEKSGDASKGKALFEQHCATCHHATSTEKKLGPGLKGLYQKRKMQNGQKPSDQSVLARLDKGGGGMPSYKELLSAEEKAHLLAYLKTL
jgi:mono/diheme cytochrome c family protein